MCHVQRLAVPSIAILRHRVCCGKHSYLHPRIAKNIMAYVLLHASTIIMAHAARAEVLVAVQWCWWVTAAGEAEPARVCAQVPSGGGSQAGRRGQELGTSPAFPALRGHSFNALQPC